MATCVCSLPRSACKTCSARRMESIDSGEGWQYTVPMPSIPSVWLPGKHTCHGCNGKGWVAVDGKAVLCPVCAGSGKVLDDPPSYTMTTSSTDDTGGIAWHSIR